MNTKRTCGSFTPGRETEVQVIPTEHPEKKWKNIIKASINAADKRGNEHNVRSVSEVLLCYKSTGNSSHEFQKFLSFLFFLPPSPIAPSAQILNGVTQSNGTFIAVCIFVWVRLKWSPHELTFPELGSNLGREIVVWTRLSSIPSSSEAGAELGEAAMLWAVANNLCALMLLGSLPYREGCSWLIEVLSRGWQLQLDLSSLPGSSPPACACFWQLGLLVIPVSQLPHKAAWASGTADSACLSNPDQLNNCVCALSQGETQKRPILGPLCISFCASISLAVRWGKDFQKLPQAGTSGPAHAHNVPRWG